MRRTGVKIILDILFYLGLIAMVVCALLFSQGMMGDQTIGGYRFFEVLTSSMDSVYPRGSLVFVKKVDPNELKVRDDITFVKNTGLVVTHRIVEVEENYSNSGQRAFTTKGVNNAAPDEDIVLSSNVIGKVTKSIPKLGKMVTWTRENLKTVLIVFGSFMVALFCIKILWKEFKRKDEVPKVAKPEEGAAKEANSKRES